MNDNQNNNSFGGIPNNSNNTYINSAVPNPSFVSNNLNNGIVNSNSSDIPQNAFDAGYNNQNSLYNVGTAPVTTVIPNTNVVNTMNNTVNSNNVILNQQNNQMVDNNFNMNNQTNGFVNSQNNVDNNDNSFISPENNYQETKLSDLNIDGTYNNMNRAPEYVNNQTVIENVEPKKKNTLKVSKELKTVLIITAVLFLFILIIPMLDDLLNNIRFQ